jgi:hypothetical protein
MMNFNNFSLANLEVCLKEFIQVWIMKDQQVEI